MALRMAVAFKGMPTIDAYIRVVAPTINPGNSAISFAVHYSASPDSGVFDTAGSKCAYDLEGDNPIAQAYEHLKTLTEFEGCIDC